MLPIRVRECDCRGDSLQQLDLAELNLPMTLFQDYVDCSGIKEAARMLETVEERHLLTETRQVRVIIDIVYVDDNNNNRMKSPSLQPVERDWCCCAWETN